jgi:hypothetical protein
MKKLLIVALVIGMVSVASAGPVISVVVTDIGSSDGRTGQTANDKLQAGDKVGLDLVLNYNDYGAQYPSYDGYLLFGMDLGLSVSSAGTLGVDQTFDKDSNWLDNVLTWDGGFSVTGASTSGANGTEDMIQGNAIASISGGALTPISANGGAVTLLSGLWMICDGEGDVTVDLSIAGTTLYADYQTPAGNPYPNNGAPYADDWLTATNAELGDVTILQVPEPVTIALLGLGGLFLRRRK